MSSELNIDLVAMRAKLTERKRELLSVDQISENSRQAPELDQTSVGRVSRIDAIQAQQMALANKRNRQRELAQIEAALTRLDDSDFGYCVTCDEPINPKRLGLNPAVPTCMSCA
ncbi:MAG: TraR/DksA family transcriptional regulator, partial [Pseudomonadota bacterium]